jgi:RNA polymerase sigma-70 factor (ECF subfamily)
MFCANVPDEEIVGYAKQDKECFACLVERYDWKIKNYVKRLTGASNETVEDIVQEVFIKVYSNIDKFDQSMRFSSWIYRIAHNQAVNKYLYEKRRKTESLIWEEDGEMKGNLKSSQDVWKEVQQEIVNEKLFSALSLVSEKYREIIALNYFGGKSYQEISLELEKPVNTIGTMLNRGKKLLKKELLNMGINSEVVLI